MPQDILLATSLQHVAADTNWTLSATPAAAGGSITFACVCHDPQMTSLRELDLSGNLLTELPHALATLPRLEVREMVQRGLRRVTPATSQLTPAQPAVAIAARLESCQHSTQQQKLWWSLSSVHRPAGCDMRPPMP